VLSRASLDAKADEKERTCYVRCYLWLCVCVCLSGPKLGVERGKKEDLRRKQRLSTINADPDMEEEGHDEGNDEALLSFSLVLPSLVQ
jgi:hypothetical protein